MHSSTQVVLLFDPGNSDWVFKYSQSSLPRWLSNWGKGWQNLIFGAQRWKGQSGIIPVKAAISWQILYHKCAFNQFANSRLFSKCDTKIRRSFKSCIVQTTCAKLYYQELYSIHCRLYRILTFVCGNFKTYLLFVHQIISSVLVFQGSFYMKMSKTQWRHKSYLKIWLWIVETVFRFWCFHFVVCMWCHNDHVIDAVMYHVKKWGLSKF